LGYVIISYILGISILLKYFEFKTRDYIFVGLAWMGISNPWLGDAISFLMIIFIEKTLDPKVYFIVAYAIIPFFILCWLIAFTDLLYPHTQLHILIAFLLLTLIFEIYFFYSLFTDMDSLGVFVGIFRIRWGLLMEIFLATFILIVIISGFMFAYVSIKSKNPEVSLKGKLILAAFILFTIAAIIETFGHLDPLTVVITRSVLISSSFVFYLGFILPKPIKNLFLKED
jgi:hypothetical protein